jgi:hypothetical protein
MNWKHAWKQVTLLGIIGGTLVTVFMRVASVAPLPDAPATSPRGASAQAALITEIERLHQRPQAPIAPMHSSRNPFTFGRAQPARRSASVGAAHEPPGVNSSAPPRAEVPAVRLVGLAEDPGPDGPLRTAIIAGSGGLQFATVGDAVGAGYRVTAIRADAVELGAPDLPSVVLELE